MSSSYLPLLFFLLASTMSFRPSEGAVYKVGDSVGWTIKNSPNYTAWALSKSFHVGDFIVFQYHNQYHNVLQVSKEAYKACNASAPLATYASGNDTIEIKTKGHHFYLCGFPGHCEAGQKVDIRVAKDEESSSFAAPSTSPAPTPVSAPSGGVAAVMVPRIDVVVAVLVFVGGFIMMHY